MDWQRNLLIIAIVAVLALLFIRWNDFQEQQAAVAESERSEELVVPSDDEAVDESGEVETAGIPSAQQTESVPEPAAAAGNERLITVETDTLRITIDTYGGDIVKTELLQHPVSREPGAGPIVILNRTSNTTYFAQSGLVGKNGTDTNEGRPRFHVEQQHFELEEGEDRLVVNLHHQQGEVGITKQFTMRRGDYLLDVNYQVSNRGREPWQASLFGQIQRDSHEPPAGDGLGMQPYLGAATTTPDTNYEKVSFSDLEDESVNTEVEGGWIAMVQHYFISAWVPDQSVENRFTLRKLGNRDLYTFGFVSPPVTVSPGESETLSASFYVGPKDQYRLQEISPYLDLTVRLAVSPSRFFT